MTIQNFEKFVDTTLVKKGKKCFEAKKVIALEEAQEGLWVANVDDKKTYEVEVLLHKNTVREFSCDCSNGQGKLCEHVVATFFAIDQNKQQGVVRKPKKLSFSKLIESISHGELVDFIKTYTENNKAFKADFELHFVEKNVSTDFEKMFADIVEKKLKPRTRNGYLSNATELGKEVKKHIKTAETYAGENNFRDGFTINKILYSKLFEIASKIGLNNTLYKYLQKIVENISFVANYEKVPLEFKKKIFKFLTDQIEKKRVESNVFADVFFKDYETLAIAFQKTDAYLALLDKKLNEVKSNAEHKKFFLTKKISLFTQLNDKAAIDKIIEKNLIFPEFREIKLQQYLEEKNYEKAKRLLKEGIHTLKQHGSIRDYKNIKEWELQLLSIAEEEKDVESIRLYAQKYAFIDENMPLLYQKWRATYTPKEWKDEIELYIEALEKKVATERKSQFRWRKTWDHIPAELEALLLIYALENQSDKLLNALKETDAAHIVTFLPFITAGKITEVFDILQQIFVIEFNDAYSRDEYKRTAEFVEVVLRYFQNTEAEEKTKELLNFLCKRYKSVKNITSLLEKIIV